MERLYEDGILKYKHESLASILSRFHEAYRFFRWLDEIFNGDLFPGRNHTGLAREEAWQAEKRQVDQSHLEILGELVSGRLHLPTGQRLLWRNYSFDAIPLEFVSSILEAFVKDRARASGIYFTPPDLVDFTLDQVLPWNGSEWDLKILDPACGSGVFLVKAFQRLVHRWKINHPQESIRAETLRTLLERNLFGIDKDPHAVRVASYNLYLAMCDEIDPRYYWTQVRFPLMRGRRLIRADFFRENVTGFQTRRDNKTYDLVVGNAPWGDRSLTKEAKAWAAENGWPTAYEGIGTMFLPKAAALSKPNGRVAIIQSASALLFNRSTTAIEFRKKFFSEVRVERIVNLSAVRFKIFRKKRGVSKTVAPSCIAIFEPKMPTGEPLLYINPKVTGNDVDQLDIVIEPYDPSRKSMSNGSSPNTPATHLPPADFMVLARRWYPDLSLNLINFVWQGYDLLMSELPAGINPRDLERSISQSLEPRIRRAMSGDEPFYIQHGAYERETMQRPPAQPPQYDLAFVLTEAERVMWPLEAKVLKTDAAVGSYVTDLRNEFLTCRYSPFSSEGGMLVYLLRGDPQRVFRNIAAKVPCTLTRNPSFPARPCQVSDHVRSVPAGKRYPRGFRCHHLVLAFPSFARLRAKRGTPRIRRKTGAISKTVQS